MDSLTPLEFITQRCRGALHVYPDRGRVRPCHPILHAQPYSRSSRTSPSTPFNATTFRNSQNGTPRRPKTFKIILLTSKVNTGIIDKGRISTKRRQTRRFCHFRKHFFCSYAHSFAEKFRVKSSWISGLRTLCTETPGGASQSISLTRPSEKDKGATKRGNPTGPGNRNPESDAEPTSMSG